MPEGGGSISADFASTRPGLAASRGGVHRTLQGGPFPSAPLRPARSHQGRSPARWRAPGPEAWRFRPHRGSVARGFLAGGSEAERVAGPSRRARDPGCGRLKGALVAPCLDRGAGRSWPLWGSSGTPRIRGPAGALGASGRGRRRSALFASARRSHHPPRSVRLRCGFGAWRPSTAEDRVFGPVGSLATSRRRAISGPPSTKEAGLRHERIDHWFHLGFAL